MDTKNEAPMSCGELPDGVLDQVGGGKKDSSGQVCPYCGSTEYKVYITPIRTAIYTCARNPEHHWS